MAKKLTLSLPPPLREAIDRYVAEHPGTTRSGITETALPEWFRSVHEAQIERYYLTCSAQERQEDAAWTDLAARSAAGLWP